MWRAVRAAARVESDGAELGDRCDAMRQGLVGDQNVTWEGFSLSDSTRHLSSNRLYSMIHPHDYDSHERTLPDLHHLRTSLLAVQHKRSW
jgi:hypothetical protein